MLFLSKLLPVFIYPLGATIAGGLLAAALVFTRFRRAAGAIIAALLIGLWVASMPIFANWLSAKLESQISPVAVETLPATDAIILLGGVFGAQGPSGTQPDLGAAGDRVLQAWRLFRAGKAPRILIAAGNLPWSDSGVPEAESIAGFLEELGVPRSALAVEGRSRNTRENATNAATIMAENGWRSALLVTSAAHMPRAIATFRKAGIPATPVPTDFRGRKPAFESLLDLLPDAEALAQTTSGIKEVIGHIVYRLRGWA